QVEGIEAVNANKFFIYTNQEVKLNDDSLTIKKGNHEFDNGNIENSGEENDTPSGENTVNAKVGTYQGKDGIYVAITDLEEESDVNLNVTLENYKDAAGNELIGEKSEQTVTLKKNDSKPTVKDTKLVSQEGEDEEGTTNQLQVIFNNDIEAVAGSLTNDDVVVDRKS